MVVSISCSAVDRYSLALVDQFVFSALTDTMWTLTFWITLIGLGVFILFVAISLMIYVTWRRMTIRGFRQKAVFITGSDKGLGRNLALELDRKGLTVYAGCHSEAGALNLQGEASKRLKTIVVEVTDRESLLKARTFIINDLPPRQNLWALVNNAGIARGMVFDFAQLGDYREVMDVNFFGVIEATEVFLPLIKKSRGRVINMISIMGRCTVAAGPYSCSKFALEAYSDGLRRSMKNFGVHVAIIEPGFFHTNMTNQDLWENEIERLWKKLPEHLQEDYSIQFKEGVKDSLGRFISHPPLASFNHLEDVTNDIVHALGARHPKSRYVNGIDAHLLYRPVSFLPDFILDFFMSSILYGHRTSNQKPVKTSTADGLNDSNDLRCLNDANL